MDDTDDDSKYSPNPYCGMNHQQGFGSSNHQMVLVKCGNESTDDDDNDEVVKDEEELGEKDEHDDDDDDDDEEEEEEEEEEEDDDDDDDDDDEHHGVQRIGYHAEYDDVVEDDHTKNENDFKTPVKVVNFKKHPNKRNLQSMIANYEFAPRVAVQSSGTNCVVRKRATSGRNPLTDWTEHETLVLLNAWGDRFVENQRKSLRTDEWQEVADKVCEESKNHRTETQCRNRVDTLKKKYKKEKMKLAETGTTSNNITAQWVFFTKMEGLMETSKPNLKVYENQANGCDVRETGLSSESCESQRHQESDELPPKRKKLDEGSSCYSLIADSIHKFGEIYEKIETSKRQQMMEIEKMWMDLHADVEMQLRQVIENSLNEIADILRGNDGQRNGVSNENISR